MIAHRRGTSANHRPPGDGPWALVPVFLCAALCALAPARSAAQAASSSHVSPQDQPPKPAEHSQPPAGLPRGLDWTFNFDANWGNFGFMNSLYANPKPDQPSGNLGDNWFEGSVKPALTGTYTTRRTWQVFGKISVVGERTYGAAPTLVGEDASSFKPEDLALGVRSGKALGKLGDDALEFTIGRAPYQLGHGFLLYDGAAEGGTRGGYWTNARKTFRFAAIARIKPGRHTVEVFYLDRDELPEAETGTRLVGVNYEAAIGEATTCGATYLKLSAHADKAPQRNGLNVYNLRAYTAPIPALRALSFEFEFAREANGDALDSHAWTARVAYQFHPAWKPTLSYRYAFFEGDDPATTKNEAFDPLFPGFSDWGSWWQGEIAGEYFVSNSNLASHQVRLHLSPSKAIGTGVIVYDFLLDKPAALGPAVTARHVAVEADWYMDWKLNQNFTLSLVAAFASPGQVVQQVYDRTKNFAYGMAFIAYSY